MPTLQAPTCWLCRKVQKPYAKPTLSQFSSTTVGLLWHQQCEVWNLGLFYNRVDPTIPNPSWWTNVSFENFSLHLNYGIIIRDQKSCLAWLIVLVPRAELRRVGHAEPSECATQQKPPLPKFQKAGWLWIPGCIMEIPWKHLRAPQ